MWAYFKFIIDVDGGCAATADDLNHFSKAKCYTLTRFFLLHAAQCVSIELSQFLNNRKRDRVL